MCSRGRGRTFFVFVFIFSLPNQQAPQSSFLHLGAMAEQKFAEKLTILNDHACALLTRLSQTKTLFVGASRPPFLQDKSFDASLKGGLKKFPQCDFPKGQGSQLFVRREEVLRHLQSHYYALVDVMELKDAVNEVMAALSAAMMGLDISINFGLTAAYLDLCRNHAAVMLLLSRLPERRLIAGLFNTAYMMVRKTQEPAYPRLGQMLVEYDQPLRRLQADFEPTSKVLACALLSVDRIMATRYLPADGLRKMNVLNMTHRPEKMAQPPTETTNLYTETVSVDRMLHWILFGYMLVPGELTGPEHAAAALRVAGDGFALTIHRAETIGLQVAFEAVFGGMRDPSRIREVRKQVLDAVMGSVTTAPIMHAARRVYLRQELKQIAALLLHRPGLLGPQASRCLTALRMASDEISWLMRHGCTPAPKGKGKVDQSVMKDPELPELLHHMMVIKRLYSEHAELVQRYYAEYLVGFDVPTARDLTAGVHVPKHETSWLRAVVDGPDELRRTSHKQVHFDGLRLDWLRLQASLSMPNSTTPLLARPKIAEVLNNIDFHTRFVDTLDEHIREAASPPGLFYFRRAFLGLFEASMSTRGQERHSTAFALACDGFATRTARLVPEERVEVGREAANIANGILSRVANTAYQTVHSMGMLHVALAEKFLPMDAARGMVERRVHGKSSSSSSGGGKKTLAGHTGGEDELQLEAMQSKLSGLCLALNRYAAVNVFNFAFAPREYLTEGMEQWYGKALAQLATDDGRIVRPSVCLAKVKAYMAALRSIENYIQIDVSSVFSAGLLDQAVLVGEGKKTLASQYVAFYLSLIDNQAVKCELAASPLLRALVSQPSANYKAEEYTDAGELRSLAALLGPFGIKQLCDRLLARVTSKVQTMQKLVIDNFVWLQRLREQTEDSAACTEALRAVTQVDEFTRDASLVGLVLQLRRWMLDGLADVCEQRIPFVYHSISDLHESVRGNHSVDSLAQSAGLKSDIDPHLLAALQQSISATDNPEKDRAVWVVFMALFAVSVHNGASAGSTMAFRRAIDGFENNFHCIPLAITDLSASLFTLYPQNPSDVLGSIRAAQEDFLRIASTLLLRVVVDTPQAKNLAAAFTILSNVAKLSPFLTADVLESYVPNSLVRNSFLELYKTNSDSRRKGEDDA